MTTTSTPHEVEVLNEVCLYDGHLNVKQLTLRHGLFAGGMSDAVTRECVIRPDAVAVVLYDAQCDCVVLVEQFRVGALHDESTPWLLECVAGLVESGEDAREVAIRETLEESGIHIESPEAIYTYYTSPGVLSEKVTLFFAECDSAMASDTAGLENEHEDIKVHVLPREEVMQWLHQGRLRNVNTVLGMQWLQAHLLLQAS